MLRRVHVNLGHPSGPDLVRYLAICGASSETLMGARGLRCTVCMRNRKPAEARPSRLPRTARFGSRLMIDIFYEPDCTGTEFMFQGELDEGTHLHVAPLVENGQP